MPRKNNPFFSVIVPAYNVEQYISKCIDSVLQQDFQDFELILVDDGSTDGTSKICDKYAKENPQITVIHQANSGLSGARNTGIERASGEYLILLDGDDYLTPGALRTFKNGIEPGLDLLRYQAEEVFSGGKVIKYQEAGFGAIPGVRAFMELMRYHYTENAWLYAYRREFFIENKFEYAEGCIAEDFGLTPLIIAKARSVKAISEICYAYRQREGSIMHDEENLARRTADIEKQLQKILPQIAKVPGADSILHYLVVSFLTEAARRDEADFLQIYRKAKDSGMLGYIHPGSLRAVPRSVLLRYFPRLFYLVYR